MRVGILALNLEAVLSRITFTPSMREEKQMLWSWRLSAARGLPTPRICPVLPRICVL